MKGKWRGIRIAKEIKKHLLLAFGIWENAKILLTCATKIIYAFY
jgi:hypothetical protein